MKILNNLVPIFRDELLQFIVSLAVGGFLITIGLQYQKAWALIVIGSFIWIMSFFWFIPRIAKSQVGDIKDEI